MKQVEELRKKILKTQNHMKTLENSFMMGDMGLIIIPRHQMQELFKIFNTAFNGISKELQEINETLQQ